MVKRKWLFYSFGAAMLLGIALLFMVWNGIIFLNKLVEASLRHFANKEVQIFSVKEYTYSLQILANTVGYYNLGCAILSAKGG